MNPTGCLISTYLLAYIVFENHFRQVFTCHYHLIYSTFHFLTIMSCLWLFIKYGQTITWHSAISYCYTDSILGFLQMRLSYRLCKPKYIPNLCCKDEFFHKYWSKHCHQFLTKKKIHLILICWSKIMQFERSRLLILNWK